MVHVHWIPVAYSNKFSDVNRILAFLKFVVCLQKGHFFKVMLSLQLAPPTIAIPGYIVSRKLSIPIVFEVRDLWPTLPIAIGSLKILYLNGLHQTGKIRYFNSARVVALQKE